MSILKKIVDVLGSFGMAIVLLFTLFLLTAFGTWAQREHGLYESLHVYFYSWVRVKWLFGAIPVPLPGAYLVLTLLAVNLLLGGLVRIRWSKRTAGVVIVHLGIALMLLSAVVKKEMSADGHLTLYEGEASDDFVSYFLWEIAIHEANATQEVQEFLIEDDAFLDLDGPRSATFSDERLPFTVTLSHFNKNCRAYPKGPMWEASSPVVEGYALKAEPLEEDAEHNLAGIYARVQPTGGGPAVESLLWSGERYPTTFQAGGRTWAMSFRHKRERMPFAIRLDDFDRALHPGTGIAKSFMSDVTKIEDGDEQKIRISMNKPLRRDGLVLFQASWGPPDAADDDRLFSTFAVVRNPSDYWPLYSLIIIGIGLVIAFGSKLLGYMHSQASARQKVLAEAA